MQRFRKELLPKRDAGSTRSTVNIVVGFSQENTMPDDLLCTDMAHSMNITSKGRSVEKSLVNSLGYQTPNEILHKRATFTRTEAQTHEKSMEGLPVSTLVVVGSSVEKSLSNVGIAILRWTPPTEEMWQAFARHAEDPKENVRPRSRLHPAHQPSVAKKCSRRSIEPSFSQTVCPLCSQFFLVWVVVLDL